MFKLIAASTFALSAVAAAIPFAGAAEGDPCPSGRCMQFAPPEQLTEALLEDARASATALALATWVAHYGSEAGSPAALLVASDMMEEIGIDPIPGAPLTLPTVEALLAEARELARDDAALLAMIDDRLEARDRGSMFEVEAFDGQGGESWVAAGDSMMFTRTYDDAADAILTLVTTNGISLTVRVVDADGELVCEGQTVDGIHSCIWPAGAGDDYAIQIGNADSAGANFTIWTN